MDKADRLNKVNKTDNIDKAGKVSKMEKIEKEALQVSKEITVKFIEIQRVSPSNFVEIFPNIYEIVLDTIIKGREKIANASIPLSQTSQKDK